jgi:hypothetical protein
VAAQDPEGKRLARARAAQAEEALQLLALAQSRVASLKDDALRDVFDGLRQDLRRKFEADESRGGGHLEARKKYKGRSQHLALEHGRGVITLYIDESGKPERDLDQPHFVLAGVAMDDDATRAYVAAANALKQSYGLEPSLCLHAPQIEKGVDDFAFGDDESVQAAFRQDLDSLVVSTDFHLLGSIIRKDKLSQLLGEGTEFPNLPPGLYEMTLTFLAERFVDMLHADQALKPCGRLIFESIGNLEDALHQRAFADLLIHGTEFVSEGCFRGWLRPGCEFRTKRGSHPIELADLAARALLNWTRADFPIEHPFLNLWGPKISTREEVERGKFGIKVFPDSDIREDVVRIRESVRDARRAIWEERGEA